MWPAMPHHGHMTTTHRDQYYVFTGPDGWAWCEMFYTEQGTEHHVTAPTPHKDVAHAMTRLAVIHPDATIDELVAEDIADAMRHTV